MNMAALRMLFWFYQLPRRLVIAWGAVLHVLFVRPHNRYLDHLERKHRYPSTDSSMKSQEEQR